jgi:hypothetical protein
MSRKLLLLNAAIALGLSMSAQTLYVPSGTGGIANSYNSNVGIGISNPLEKLHLSGSIRGASTGGALRINTANGYIDIGAQNTSNAHIYTDRNSFLFNKPIYSSNGQFSSYSTNNLQFQTNGTTQMTITPNGSLGLACDPGDATFKLFKSSLPDFRISNGTVTWRTFIATDGQIVLKPEGAVHKIIFDLNDNNNDGNSYFQFGDLTGGFFKIYNNKKVRLDGTFYAKEIIVKTDIWSDYVFDTDYRLMPLLELESFIKENRHLPSMPTGNEIMKSGINVAEMNVLLLEKIEELTLYIIEFQKRVEDLTKRIEISEKRSHNSEH